MSNEKEYPPLGLKKSPRKLRQQDGQNFVMEEKKL